jgi:hypothetical protein
MTSNDLLFDPRQSYSPSTGEAVPIDHSYVSPDLIEWGQVPLGFEIFSVESSTNQTAETFTQQLVRILPEAGCAADNVASESTSRTVDLGRGGGGGVQGRVFPLSDLTVHTIDTHSKPGSGEANSPTAPVTPHSSYECRTCFYGLEKGGLGLWPCDLELIGSRRSSTVESLASTKRLTVDLKFDFDAVPQVTDIVLGAMRRLEKARRADDDEITTTAADDEDEEKKTDENTALLAALKASANQEGGQKQHRPRAHRLGLDAWAVASAIGGKPWFEHLSPDGDCPWAAQGHNPGSVEVNPTSGVTVLRLSGNVEVCFGLITDTNSETRSDTASWPRSDSRAARAFLVVSLVRADGTCSACVRREFTEEGDLVYVNSEIPDGGA